MMRLVPVVAMLAVLVGAAGCGGSPVYEIGPSGRPRQVCQGAPTPITVQAVDDTGAAIGGAEVLVRNTSSGQELKAVTGGNGFAGGITDDIGNGHVDFTATAGALSTKRPFTVQVLCGECDCTVMPSSVKLTLEAP
ncbi:MAG: carboxypeptidase regulatory-like domain-containing protein [Myxococcaceae bacterium]|nr:carboxypeptidase regulatory-like domain-containing protein [Myxococcaceae bacterium]